MNTTQSGAIAIGAPMSKARMMSEAQHALKSLNIIATLRETDEGEALLKSYIQISYDWSLIEFLKEFINGD